MGAGQSSVRSSHFQNEHARDDPDDDEDKPHRISISNKMVERLVEDATVAGSVAAALPKSAAASAIREAHDKQTDAKERVLTERLKNLDDNHSEKIGLTLEDVRASVKRVELRTAHLRDLEPVCQDCAEKLVACYDKAEDRPAVCADLVSAFTKCVQETSVSRLRARTARAAMEAARRTRHVAQARHRGALKDISLPPQEVPT